MTDRLTRFPAPQQQRVAHATDPKRRVMHIDMDAFFASIEQADNPHLRGKPVIVGGGHGGRGVVTAASYECRAFGVRSGMPASEARRLCPQAVFVSVNARQYIDVSHRLRAIFAAYSPCVEAVSVDEAFLDLTGCMQLFGGEVALARSLKNRIRDELSLSCSVGIAPNKIMAKLASSVYKPDGLTVLNPDDYPRLVYPLPVRKLWGIGPTTEKKLTALGVHTIGDLAAMSLSRLHDRCGLQGEILGRIARGEDASPVVGVSEKPREKSIGHEHTFDHDSADSSYLHAMLRELADRVGRRLRRGGFVGRTITVKIRYADFTTFTRRQTLPAPTDAAKRIASVAVEIFSRNYDSRSRIRLLGVSLSRLSACSESAIGGGIGCQEELFPTGESIQSAKDLVVDAIRDRFGEQSLLCGSASFRRAADKS